ncbi:GntR family transcriptional regulator [Paracandidimonas soli]|uniref:GntR family transcriptional regulator n=2 Tax=Paracandidimonas soli TaxID=1917182 RepID=A0A4R3VH63_9BURK|nr:GntR family transcriptional regulator [Paracandidimonas soli]
MHPMRLIPPLPETAPSPIAQLVDSRLQQANGKLSVDDVVSILQEAIIRGIYAPGRALRQDDLAHAMGISKIPIREALRTLQANGFVELHQHRGAIVKELTLAQLREAFYLREMLEPDLMRDATAHMDDATLDKLEALVAQMDGETNAWRFSELNAIFHQTLYAPSGRALSMQILAMLQGHIQRMSFMQLSLSGHNNSANEEHRAIVAACRRRDASQAVRLVEQHVAHIRQVILVLYEQQSACLPPLSALREDQP